MTFSDVIIIGSGPIGAICARKLAENGLDVTMLEAGKIISTPPGEHLRNQRLYQSEPDKFFEIINKWCDTFDNNVPPEQLPGANFTAAFGGQGLLWTNNCPRPAEHEYWPAFSKEKWNALLQEAESYLQVSQHLFDNSVRQKNIIATLSALLEKQGREIQATPVAATRAENGCLRYIATHEILHQARITIHCEATVLELIKKNGEITTVKIRQQGKVKDCSAKYIIVAGGAFGTTQLLFNSDIHSSALGKYLHFHPLYCAQLVLDKKYCADESIIDIAPRTCILPTPSHPWFSLILRDLLPFHSDEKIHENRLVELQYFVPIEVQERNQMFLNKHKKPRFKVKLSPYDEAILKATKQDLELVANTLGRFRDSCSAQLLDFGFTHPMGMTRMGEDPLTSVCNMNGRVHGLDNLYIAGVGLIPKSIAVNPTLIAGAIAIASCDDIINAKQVNEF